MAFRGDFERPQNPAASSSQSLVSPRSVSYCCGSCGYALNLSSADRYMTNIGAKYRKSIKKGIVSFVSVDESRFSQVEELRCRPYFVSWQSWGLMRRRTKLFCRNCRNFVGFGYEDGVFSPLGSDNSDFSSGNGEAAWKKYDIKIKALQPLSWDNSGAAAGAGGPKISIGRSTLSTSYTTSWSSEYTVCAIVVLMIPVDIFTWSPMAVTFNGYLPLLTSPACVLTGLLIVWN